MKNTFKTLLTVGMIALIVVSCSDDDGPQIIGLTEEEAAEQVSSVLISDVNGVTSDVRALSNSAISQSGAGRAAAPACGVLFDTLINYQFDGANVQFDVSLNYDYGLNCTNNIPDELEFNFGSTSTYEGRRISRTGTASGMVTAGGLRFNDTSYDVDGSLTSNSSVTQKERNQKTFTGESSVTLTDVMVNKATKVIESGAASVTANGASSDGESYQFTASVEYLGGNVAIVTINEQRFSVDLNTGEVTPL